MAYGVREFPACDFEGQDMHEFIMLYKELVDDYSGTLKMIQDVSTRLDKYTADMNAQISNITNVIVPQSVNSAVANAMAGYQQEINTIKARINAIDSQINALQNSTVELDSKIDSMVSTLRGEIQSAYTNLVQQISVMQNYLHTQIEVVETDLNDKIEKLTASMIVRDEATYARATQYTDSKIADIQKLIEQINLEIDKASIKWVWDNGCNFGGYSAWLWYQETPITAQEWHDKKFTCVDWYVRGREIFSWFKRRMFMFSPITGRYESVQHVVYDLCNVLKINGITAQEYEDRQITAQQYEEWKLRADEYDWDGWRKTYVHKDNNKSGTAVMATT